MTFGEKLRELRKSKGLTQKELGKMLKVGEMTVSGYETGSREPNFETLLSFSKIFEVTTDYLLDNPEAFKDKEHHKNLLKIQGKFTLINETEAKFLEGVLELKRRNL